MAKELKPCMDMRGKCAAKDNDGNCVALSDTYFGTRICPFYKTAEENKRQCDENAKRLDGLRKWQYYKSIYGKVVSK